MPPGPPLLSRSRGRVEGAAAALAAGAGRSVGCTPSVVSRSCCSVVSCSLEFACLSSHLPMDSKTQACGHFPNETAALKRLYLATLALDPTGRGRQHWNNRWKSALNEFDLLFGGRLTAGRVWTNRLTGEPVGLSDESPLIPDRPVPSPCRRRRHATGAEAARPGIAVPASAGRSTPGRRPRNARETR